MPEMYTAGAEVFFEPKKVAVVGASPRPDNLGRAILENLLTGFKGKVYVVNPGYTEVLGLKSYPSVQAVPDEVDLVVVATPARLAPRVVEDAGAKGAKGVVVFSGGFAETGTDEGRRLQEEVVEVAKRHGVRLLGPNCIGVYNYSNGLDTFFLPRSKMKRPPPGPIALVSQSGALLATLMDWASARNIGISKAINFGNKADVDEVDSLEYMAKAPDVKAMVVYLEGVTRGRALIDAIRLNVNEGKPVIAVKGGRFQATARATLSHTASIAGSYDVFKEAMREAGALLFEDLEAAFDAAKVLVSQPLPRGPRVGIITNSGGHGVIAADTVTAEGLEVPETPAAIASSLRQIFPDRVSLRNPIDLTGDARPEQYKLVAQALVKGGLVDSLLLISLVQPPTMDVDETLRTIELIRDNSEGVPLVVVTIGAEAGAKLARALEELGIPTFELPDRAARALASLLHFRRAKDIIKPRGPAPTVSKEAFARAKEIIQRALSQGRSKLLEDEALELLRAYGVKVADFCVARSEEEASACAEKVGPRLAMKVISPDISHKSDVGGVLVGVTPETAVSSYRAIINNVKSRAPGARVEGVLVQRLESGHEVMVGGLNDMAFGPVVTFGAGGLLVELLGDVAMRLSPLDQEEALEMIKATKVYRLLKGFRGEVPANIDAIADIVVKVSLLLNDHDEIKELDINPILANQDTATAVDARVIVTRGGGQAVVR